MISGISSSQISSSIFSKLDTKNQGYLEKTDLASALSELDDGSAGSNEVDALFSALDSDSDGKVTQDEMSSAIDNLFGQLNSQFDQMRMQNGMPPPPPPSEENSDEGYSQDELSSIASTTDDTKLANLMSDLAENFDAADTNEDGKVSAQEAMAYQRSQDEANGKTQGNAPADDNSNVVNISRQIQQLIAAYGDSNATTSSLAYSA